MKKKGFTLIELMVTIAIMLIMVSVVFFNYGRFNENTLLNSIAYDLSLTIRQAQVYGTAAKEVPGGGHQSGLITTADIENTNFSMAYGVHFDSKTSETSNSFIMFIDSNGSGDFDSGEELQTYTFPRGIHVEALCFTPNHGGGQGNCTIETDPGKKTFTLDITFLRPDPEARILPDDPGQEVDAAKIYLSNSTGSTMKSVAVYSTGQISVQ